MLKMTTSEARKNFSEVLDQVRKGERAILKKHGKPVAAIVSVDDLRLLRAIEKRRDLAAARAAMKEEGRISWDDLKAELGL